MGLLPLCRPLLTEEEIHKFITWLNAYQEETRGMKEFTMVIRVIKTDLRIEMLRGEKLKNGK